MSFYVTYPRCYLREEPSAERNAVSKGDHEVVTLWDLYMNDIVNAGSWAFRKQVMDAAVRLFDHFSQWVAIQSNSPHVAGYNLDFIRDTLNYIQTGERRIGVLQWLELLSEIDEITTINPSKQQLALNGEHKLLSTTDTIQKWCAWPGGFDDLIRTLFVLFGSPRELNISGNTDNTKAT